MFLSPAKRHAAFPALPGCRLITLLKAGSVKQVDSGVFAPAERAASTAQRQPAVSFPSLTSSKLEPKQSLKIHLSCFYILIVFICNNILELGENNWRIVSGSANHTVGNKGSVENWHTVCQTLKQLGIQKSNLEQTFIIEENALWLN